MKDKKEKDLKQMNSSEKISKIIVKGIDSTVNYAVLVIFLLLFTFGCYAMWDTQQIINVADASQYEEYKPKEDSLSFEQLQRINPEVFGWLTVYGTGIDYPLVQGDNDNKYVNTNAEGEYALSGSIFLSCQNKKDFTDFNSIIYGHHMAEHAMFGDIENFKEESYFNAHKYGTIFYEGKEYGLEFFSFLETDAYDSTVYALPIVNDAEKQNYLNTIQEKSKFYRESVNPTINDHIILLSTCASESTNGRYLLIGRITTQIFENTFTEDAEEEKIWSVDGQSVLKFIKTIPMWAWVLAFILVVLSIVLKVLNKRQKDSEKSKRKR